MSKSLYCLCSPSSGTTFGIRPYKDQYWADYCQMRCKVGLKADLGWSEVQELHRVLTRSDIWEDFPAKGYTLVASEFKAGDEEQRIDILYLRDDGALLPCQLKIGGESFDSHGQLIRYISDLHFQPVNFEWIKRYHEQFLSRIEDEAAKSLHKEKFSQFLDQNDIENQCIRILPRTGIVMDEDFKPQMLKAVRYLNGYCGFAIRLLQIEVYVDDSWSPSVDDYMFRIDFTDIQ